MSAGLFRRLRFVVYFLSLSVLAALPACVPKNAPEGSLAPGAAPPAPGHDVVAAARKSLGVPYRFGGTSPQTGFDCSGLVLWSYEQVGVRLPRSAREQIGFGIPVQRAEDLKPGDIVVFKGIRSRTGWHSGIYSGNGKFIHSPTRGKAVMESGMDEDYFARRFAGARRIPRNGSEQALYVAYLEKVKGEKAAAAAAAPSSGKNPEKSKSGKKYPARHQAKVAGHTSPKSASARRRPDAGPAAATKKQRTPVKQTVAAVKKRNNER
ncbi:MAG: C40 family peptidase [Desulfovibrio sp.]|nr:C40 family peptidase [Desulfovibrio sp.]